MSVGESSEVKVTQRKRADQVPYQRVTNIQDPFLTEMDKNEEKLFNMNCERDNEQCTGKTSTRKQKRRKKKSVATIKDNEQESSDEEWEWNHMKKVQNTNIEREFDAY